MDLPPVENGDKPFVQVNIQTLDSAVKNIATDNKLVTDNTDSNDTKN
jgi:hypothetical protein